MHCAFSWITTPAMSVPWHTGGDIACAVETPAAVRVLIGDVMGHGAEAAGTAAEVTRAFRELAIRPDPAHLLAMRLDEFITGREGGEEFVTAQIISVPKDSCGETEIVCCGHPPPLLLRDGRAVFLDTVPAAPPLGLLDMSARQARAWPLDARPGDGLLLYTDGVTDACDSGGRPFALAERAAALAPDLRSAAAALAPGQADHGIGTLRADLLRHTGGRLRDDATLLHIQFAEDPCTPTRAGTQDGDARIWFSAHYR